jgi:ketosteroid isomerase-like protein
MKRLIVMPLLIGLCAGMVLAQTPATSGKAAQDELKQIENDWSNAQKARDAKRLGEILADDWVGLGWDGERSDKAKALEDVKSPSNALDSFQMGPMKVRIFGNVAVVTGSDTEKSKEHGKDSSGKYIWTDVFVNQNGKWKAVASQSAKVAE